MGLDRGNARTAQRSATCSLLDRPPKHSDGLGVASVQLPSAPDQNLRTIGQKG